MLGILQASRRYTPEREPFRPFARTYANGEMYHYLRDKRFLIKVPASWRELDARGQKMLWGSLRRSCQGGLAVVAWEAAAVEPD